MLDREVRLTKFENVIPEGMMNGTESTPTAPKISKNDTTPKMATTNTTPKMATTNTTPKMATTETATPSDNEEEDVVMVRKLRRELPAEDNPPHDTRDAVGGISTEDAFDGYQPEVVAPINAWSRAVCEE